MNWIHFLFYIIPAYLLGSINAAILLCKLFKLPDPRQQGSGNPGATNMLRVGGKGIALVVLLFDAAKGAIAVWLAAMFGATSYLLAATGLAAFLGHLYPIYFGFRGGKGVATGFGVLLGLSPILAGLVLATWLIMTLLFRISSLSALCAAILTPIYMVYTTPQDYWWAIIVMDLLLIWRHRTNIKRLLYRQEEKLTNDPNKE